MTNRQVEDIAAFARQQGLVVMAGAGVSSAAPTRLPGWFSLNRMIVRALCDQVVADLGAKYEPAIAGLRNMIDDRRTSQRFPPDYQAQLIEELCGERYFHAIGALDAVRTPNEGHRGIARLAKQGAVRAIVTTNFDSLIERCLEEEGVEFRVGYEPATYEAILTELKQFGATAGPLPLLKVHGTVQEPASLVDTLKQRLQGRNTSLEACLDLLLARHYWLILGFSADDLESDANYLRLVPGAPQSPGLTYVRWPGSPELSRGAGMLLQAYADKHQAPVTEIHAFLQGVIAALDLDTGPVRSRPRAVEDSTALIEQRLAVWARSLKPTVQITTLAAMAEANGASERAFYLVHKYWDDPRDRDSADFVALRAIHGRLGMAQGLLSLTDQNPNTSKHEESFQNLLRLTKLHGDQRGYVWAALARMWAGQRALALELLAEVDPNARVTAEVSADSFIALAELFYLMTEPEFILRGTWAKVMGPVLHAGDLPRATRVAALAALHYAEFDPSQLDGALALPPVAAALQRAARLNDPVTNGFLQLARGRRAVKQQEPMVALDALYLAGEAFKAGARHGWRVFVVIESVKALLDLKRPEEARQHLSEINGVVDRYQVWLPWYQDAVGQFHDCLGRREQAVEAFQLGIEYARRMQNERMAEKLQTSLAGVMAGA
jgi:hypothetical protein